MQLQAGTVIAGKFRLNNMIGRGGMGSVWNATHLALDTSCAVKFIEGEFAQHPEAHARFEREAKAAAMLRSAHVVTILDHGVCDGMPYIAMELLEGEDLGKRIAERSKLAPSEVQSVVGQVCRALGKAHQAGIVHRDLKPDNIFIVREDDREIVKVLDFGIAKKSSTQLDGGSNTKTGAMLGTPYYMSPEQAQGVKSVDHRSDLWSLAVIVFQCLTGRLPFESEALGDLLVKIIVSPVPVPSQLGPVPAGFDAWWAKAANREPAMRFGSAKEFADSLAAVLTSTTEMVDRRPAGGSPYAGTVAMPLPTPRTPQPYPGGSDPRLPAAPHALTPNAANAANAGVPAEAMKGPVMPSTGDGMARTYGGMPYEIPKKGNGLVIGIVAGVVLLLLIGGVVVGFAMKGDGGKATAGATPSAASATASAGPSATEAPTATATAVVATAAPTDSPPSGATSATATAIATATATPVAAKAGGTRPPVAPQPIVQTAPKGTASAGGATTPSKPTSTAKRPDLGF
jgi:serine/threonine-protein kinase